MSGALDLDRIAIEEAGPNPDRLAAAIHSQLRHKTGPVPVHDIAKALDIVEIREEPLKGLEGAVVTTPDRNVGSIIVNSGSNPPRRRFTIAHELGHFLNSWHRPHDASGRFACSQTDLGRGWRKPSSTDSRRATQEIEANRFAIELLAPLKLVRPFLFGVPDLAKVLDLSASLSVSREAAARRYVELHAEPTALIFSRDGAVRYVDRRSEFPFVSVGAGQRLADLPSPADNSGLSAHLEADPRDWLSRPGDRPLVMQTLSQQNGYTLTLLAFDGDRPDSEDDE